MNFIYLKAFIVSSQGLRGLSEDQAKQAATADPTDWRTSCPIARLTNARFATWLSGTTSRSTTALVTTSRHSSPGLRQSTASLVRCAGYTTLAYASSHDTRTTATTLATASSASAAFVVAANVSSTNASGRGNFSFKRNSTLRGNDAFDRWNESMSLSSSSSCCFCFFVSGSVGEDVVGDGGNAAGELDDAGNAGGWSGGWR